MSGSEIGYDPQSPPPLKPLIDHRDELAGKPGLHIFLVGISDYPHLAGGRGPVAKDTFGMGQLASPALSAFRFYQWLERRQKFLPLPVAACWLLVAPSEVEIESEEALKALKADCTLRSFRRHATAWRDAACPERLDSAHNMTLFYFAGHGVRTTDKDGVMLMQDIFDGDGPPLDKSVDIGNLHACMASSKSRPKPAGTQLYFVDACRVFPDRFKSFPAIKPSRWEEPELPMSETRQTSVFFATLPGSKAYGRRGGQTLFSKALEDCLDGAGAEAVDSNEPSEQWRVSTHSLYRPLEQRLAELALELATEVDKEEVRNQMLTSGHYSPNIVLHYLEGAPELQASIEVDPDHARTFTRVELHNDDGTLITQPPLPGILPRQHHRIWLKAGFYQLSGTLISGDSKTLPPGYRDRSRKTVTLAPCGLPWKVRMLP